MISPKRNTDQGQIRISASCLAELATSYGRPAESVLRPFKFNRRGEGFARSSYYRYAIAAIRAYHASGNEPKTLETVLSELHVRADNSPDLRDRHKLEKNITAIEAYRRIYKDRRFKILPNHRIGYQIGKITVTVQPDLWAEERGTLVLLKIGITKKKLSYVDMILTIMRKAAVSSHYPVRAKNVVYLNISTRQELICKGPLTRFNRTFKAKAKEIELAWPRMEASPIPGT